jgi:hypothetical protein
LVSDPLRDFSVPPFFRKLVVPVALKEWGEDASDNPAALSRHLSILAASS